MKKQKAQTPTRHSKVVAHLFNRRYIPHVLALLLFMLLSGAAAIRLGQDVNFDLHNYHYSNPHFLIEGEVEKNIAVSGVQSYENPLRDMPAYLLMSSLSPKKAGFALGALQGINLWLVFEIVFVSLNYFVAVRWKRFASGATVATFSLFGSGFYSELGTTMGDSTTSIFVLLAVLLLVYSTNYHHKFLGLNTLGLLSLLSVGVAAGLKLTNIVFLLGIFVASLVVKEKQLPFIKVFIANSVTIMLGVVLAAGAWFLKIWLLFKNPIFPFYNGLFKSDYYPHENFIDGRWTQAPLWQALLEPFSYVKHQAISSEVFFKDPRLAVTIAVIVLVLGYSAYIRLWSSNGAVQKKLVSWTKEYKLVLIFASVAYVTWAIQFSYYRYLIAVELLSLVLITLSIFMLLKRFWISSLVVLILCIGITANTVQTSWGRVPWQSTNFGVSEENFKSLDDSTIIIAGYQPYSFLLPYMPRTTEALRIESDLSSPGKGSEKMQTLLSERLNSSINSGRRIYLIRVDEDKKYADSAEKKFGLREVGCKEIPVIVRHISKNKYRLCQLEQI